MKNTISSKAKIVKKGIINSIKNNTSHFFDTSKVEIKENDKRKVWAFCSGHNSQDFRGNPKYLFLYINNYRKDIFTYWLCDNIETIKFIRKMGYNAYLIGTKQSEEAISKTGVLITEQVKESIPSGLENVIYVNLWHGVGGVKNVERSLYEGILSEALIKKYIKNNYLYLRNEMYLAPSKFIEEIAIDQLGLDETKIIRAGYPRCIYQKRYNFTPTYDTNIVEKRNLPSDTKIVTYAPTWRNEKEGDFFKEAIPDIKKLIGVCEKNHLLFIFKMHPFLENEPGFIEAKEYYKNNPWIVFWDNQYDFYEIMPKIDLCIMDFSSIYTDFILMGTKHYIRYIFDYDKLSLEFPMNYDDTTLGKKCYTFGELLLALETYQNENLEKEINKITKLYWEYSTPNDMDKIIKAILDFQPSKQPLTNLYSFDIFDTLISRKVLVPEGIFYYVKEKMVESRLNFPEYIINDYPNIRKNAELNVREYYTRSKEERKSNKCEIQFDEIFERLKYVYGITKEQAEKLKEWELEAELENVIPIEENISKVKALLKENKKVILISDMYLPKKFIIKLLNKVEPELSKLDIYLSSEYGYMKADKTLYLEVYKKYNKKYFFDKWIHTGDNPNSDDKVPKKLYITTSPITKIEFNKYELDLIKQINSYDAYLIAASLARFRNEHPNLKEQFVYSYVSLLFVPYIYWALNHAKKDKDEIVYFVSRDGHNLKKIADVINEKLKLNMELKYIYASRKTWRIPSFIDKIDDDFWGNGHGNFNEVKTFDKILKALDINREKFKDIFPELIKYENTKEITPNDKKNMISVFRSSKKYNDYLLNKAKEERESVCGYLKQEINSKKQFSIIEYWGRGYTQENFTRLWNEVIKKKEPTKFYYSRSTLPSDEMNIRYNYTVNSHAQQFIESIFACIDYKSITGYKKVNNKWEPIIEKQKCDNVLFKSLEYYLPKFAEMYCEINFINRDRIGRSLIDFAINYYQDNPTWEGFVEILSEQVDSVQLYGQKTKYAPKLTEKDILKIRFNKEKINLITKNPTISVNKSSEKVQKMFTELYQVQDINNIIETKKYKRIEIKKSIDKINRLNQYKKLSQKLNTLYEKYSIEKFKKNKIVVFTDNNFKKSYKSLIQSLNKQNIYEVEYISIDKKINFQKIAKELLKAKYIILSEPHYLLSDLEMNQETKTVILGNVALPYLVEGYNKRYPLNSYSQLNKYIYKVNASIIQCASEETSLLKKKIYTTNINTNIMCNGAAITDCYFDNELKQEIVKKVNNIFAPSKKKKIISFITYARYKNSKEQFIILININDMKKKLGNEYVLLIKYIREDKDNFIGNNLNIKNFSKDVSNKFTTRELMIASDIIIGDYINELYESPLLNKPTFIFGWDSENFESTHDTFIKINNEPYGYFVNTTEELINCIKNISNYKDDNSQKIKEKYLKKCDGKSAERLVEFLIKKSDK